jgi:hypothetical protein
MAITQTNVKYPDWNQEDWNRFRWINSWNRRRRNLRRYCHVYDAALRPFSRKTTKTCRITIYSRSVARSAIGTMIPIMPDEESQKLSEEEQNAQWDRELDLMTEEDRDRFYFNCSGHHLGDPIPEDQLIDADEFFATSDAFQ